MSDPAPVTPRPLDAGPSAAARVAAVAAGGALGALLRAAQADVLPGRGPAGSMAGTLLVNVVGTLALGALLGLLERGRGPALARPLLGVGVFGAYTTFATFEAVTLRAARTGDALLFVAGSLLLGLAAAVAGQRLGRRGPQGLTVVALLGPALALGASYAALGRAPALGAGVALAVAAGGALGALGRFGLTLLGTRASRTFPWGTLAANVAGSFLLSLVAASSGVVDAFVVVGLLGGLTTFSTFACEVQRLVESGRAGMASVSLLANVLLGLLAAGLGVALVGAG